MSNFLVVKLLGPGFDIAWLLLLTCACAPYCLDLTVLTNYLFDNQELCAPVSLYLTSAIEPLNTRLQLFLFQAGHTIL